jgi:hypothetical protein
VPFRTSAGASVMSASNSHDYSDGPASYNRNRWHLQLCAP